MAHGRPVFEKKAEVRNRKGKGKGPLEAAMSRGGTDFACIGFGYVIY